MSESIAERIRTAYVHVHNVLDGPVLSGLAAQHLSDATGELAVAHYELTGEKIGHALGWSESLAPSDAVQ